MPETKLPETRLTDESTTLTLPIQGMTCAACQTHVERALRETSGVEDATVNLMTHTARVVFNPRVTAPASLVAAVQDAGYEAELPRPPAANGSLAHPQAHEHVHDVSPDEERSLKLRAGFLLAAAVVCMVLSMPQNVDFMGLAQSLRLSMLGLSAVGMWWAGGGVYRRAWRAALHRSTNMNTLVALGTTAAFLYSVAATFFPQAFLRHGLEPNVYYESVLWILGFLLLGQWLEARTKRRTLTAVESFAKLQPRIVRIRSRSVESRSDATEEVEVPLGAVLPGDIVLVRPGERIAVDGIVLSGLSTADESLLTGESAPVPKSPGSELIGGSLNYEGALEYRATSVGSQGVLGQMLRLIDEAQSSRAPMQQLADRVSSIFVPVVLALALISFAAWIGFGGGASRAFAVTVTVLVIACPCALGLAIPAALTTAVGRGAQLGILFKGGEAVERLASVDCVVFDKTGTLTQGRPEIVALDAEGDPDSLLRLAASLEEKSEHPLARAVAAKAKDSGVVLAAVPDSVSYPGKGITGTVEGHAVAVGNAALLKDLGISLAGSLPPEQSGASRLYVAVDGRYCGFLEARDQLRATARQAVERLRASGFTIAILTGDSFAAARPIAEELGISRVFASLSPAQKLEAIRELQSGGKRVAMVGDGVNDAAALVQADAGIAIGSGTDIAQDAGNAILLGGEPLTVVAALGLARQARRVMRQNLGWALGYNVLGIPIAAGALFPFFGILLSPAIASAAMAFSSISVLLNSLRLKGFRT
jgi:P-type Cu+ transporter